MSKTEVVQQKVASLSSFVSDGKFSLWGINNWLEKSSAGIPGEEQARVLDPKSQPPAPAADVLPNRIGGMPTPAAGKEHSLLSGVHRNAGLMGRKLHQMTGRVLPVSSHAMGYGAGALGAAGLYGLGRMLFGGGGEEGKTASDERLGSPFTDGFLTYCINNKLQGEKVAEMIEKGAALEDRTGKECKAFLDKVLSK